VCDLENLKNEEAKTSAGSQLHSKKKLYAMSILVYLYTKITTSRNYNGDNKISSSE
jgi:hypothetical protein